MTRDRSPVSGIPTQQPPADPTALAPPRPDRSGAGLLRDPLLLHQPGRELRGRLARVTRRGLPARRAEERARPARGEGGLAEVAERRRRGGAQARDGAERRALVRRQEPAELTANRGVDRGARGA